jgi:stalled ribosome rescue protein Dom34
MNKKVGLWINRKKAVIVSIADDVEARRIITSDMEHYVLYSTVVPGDGAPEELRDRRFWNHLGEYYDKIVAHIRDATEILIFGPEVAKYELQKYLESAGLAGYIVSLEDAGMLTDPQIFAKVQKRFPIRSRFDLS